MSEKKRSAMGRGLGALLDMGEQGEYTEVHIDRITPNPYQPRDKIDQNSLRELAESIEEHGILQPLTVRRSQDDDRYQLVAGERRWRAARLAGQKTVPVIIRDFSRRQMMELALIENLQRKDLNPIEEAKAFQTLLQEFDLTQEELSDRIKKSRSSISNTLRLLKLPSDLKELVAENKLSEGHARALLGIDFEDKQKEICEEILSRGLSVRETERIIREQNQITKPEQPSTSDEVDIRSEDSSEENVSRETDDVVVSRETQAELVGLEEELSDRYQTQVNIKMSSNRGKIEIEFYDTEDLTRLLEIMLERS